MHSAQAISKLEKHVEASMSPQDWGVLLADAVAGCETLDEYLSANANAESLEQAPLFRALLVYRRLRRGKDTEALIAAETECRTLHRLVMQVNSDLVQVIRHEEVVSAMALECFQTFFLAAELLSVSTEEPIRRVAGTEMAHFPGFAVAAAPRLAQVQAYQQALAIVSQEHFRGHAFVARSSVRRLEGIRERYERFLEQARTYSAEVREQLPEQIVPTAESPRALADTWLRRAEREARNALSPDPERSWQDFRAACRGQNDEEIALAQRQDAPRENPGTMSGADPTPAAT